MIIFKHKTLQINVLLFFYEAIYTLKTHPVKKQSELPVTIKSSF